MIYERWVTACHTYMHAGNIATIDCARCSETTQANPQHVHTNNMLGTVLKEMPHEKQFWNTQLQAHRD